MIEKLLDYNLVDVEGLVLLNERFGLVQDQFEQAELVVAPPEDGIYASKMHDHDTIRDFRNEMVFDTKYQKWERPPLKSKKQIGDKFTITLGELERQARERGHIVDYKSLRDIHKVGGFVPEPLSAGTFEWVVVFDFNKQYPNAILSSNAGIKTAIVIDYYDEDFVYTKKGDKIARSDLIETPIGFFRKDIQSVNKKKFTKWLNKRYEAQDKANEYLKKVKDEEDPFFKLLDGKQFRVKTFTNGGFGVMGYKKDRNFSLFVFNNCTVMCQDLTMKMMEIVKDNGYKMIGGDTDSVFVQLDARDLKSAIGEAESIVEGINQEIDLYLEEVYNIQDHSMKVGIETISDKFLVKASKNYVKRNVYKDGVILAEPQLEVKGIEMKKRNTSRNAADMQMVLVNILLDSEDIPADFKILMNALDKGFEKLPWQYIAPKGALNNKMDSYNEGHYNSRGAKNARAYFNKQLQPGDNPYIMPFKVFPKQMNGKFVSPYKSGDSLVLSFNEEDIEEIRDAGFIPDYEDLKRSQIHLKAEPFLNLIDTDFYKMKAQTKVSSDMVL